VLSTKDWKLPPICDSASSRRTVSVSVFTSNNGRNLKIFETCSNGKCFFVLIPSDDGSAGWWSLLRLLQSWIALVLAPPPPSVQGMKASGTTLKSYAQAVRGPNLSSQGSCVGYSMEADSSIKKLGDGLWLIFCDSKSKVNKNVEHSQWLFGDRRILSDRWIPSAGRSKVLLKEDVVWITVRGIPLHLRSDDLFRQLGTACGVYIDHEDGDSLSSIRIKIKMSGAVPEEVLICHEDLVFSVSIEKEAVGLPKALSLDSAINGRWRNKGKYSFFPSSLPSSSEGCSSLPGSPTPSDSCLHQSQSWGIFPRSIKEILKV
ncbi:hypothetical protein LINPERHAP2_LOCUS1137, partial [Linum perenne]